MEFTHKSTGK